MAFARFPRISESVSPLDQYFKQPVDLSWLVRAPPNSTACRPTPYSLRFAAAFRRAGSAALRLNRFLLGIDPVRLDRCVVHFNTAGTLRWSGRNRPPFVREITRRPGGFCRETKS